MSTRAMTNRPVLQLQQLCTSKTHSDVQGHHWSVKIVYLVSMEWSQQKKTYNECTSISYIGMCAGAFIIVLYKCVMLAIEND